MAKSLILSLHKKVQTLQFGCIFVKTLILYGQKSKTFVACSLIYAGYQTFCHLIVQQTALPGPRGGGPLLAYIANSFGRTRRRGGSDFASVEDFLNYLLLVSVWWYYSKFRVRVLSKGIISLNCHTSGLERNQSHWKWSLVFFVKCQSELLISVVNRCTT